MGVDLTFAPGENFVNSMEWFLAYERIRCPRCYGLFDCIKAKNPEPIPATWKFDWYGDEGLHTNKNDAYGTPLAYLPASKIAEALDEFVSTQDWRETPHKVNALRAYFAHLEPSTPVVLYWH